MITLQSLQQKVRDEIVILKGLYPIGKSWQTVKVKELGHLNNFSPARSYVYIYA